uniref:DUF1409 domain-containing protein n=2 Tax=Oryza sativa subsp. japonica TaxID=39947 RepID=Q2R7S9_ORYSJ|nr:hypothetical protein LOC_Os11g15070 [Oryza sativa Japonica Group]ABA92510.1 hypothetical protein LOC_Os11g15070 [Oryza sativa Japonica Group]
MSTSASPSTTPSAEYAEHLSDLVATPSLSHERHYFLGPIGNLDPTEFISAETNRIPFRLANQNLGHWKNTFKSWPSLEKTAPEKSWAVWYKRISASKQALALTIANSAKDEPLMAAATYFWSNTINAFLFNQGPMTPTLLDITMITDLDVTSSANPMSLNTKNQFDFRTKSKRLFLAEALDTKKQFPLGKILLGYLYQMLNNASAKIAVGSVVNAGGPWWLLQTWLNLVAMKAVNRPAVTEAEFPRLEPITDDDGEERTHRRCMSYGEYASTPADAGAKLSAELLKDWFCSFYEGFQKDARVWFPYEDSVNLDLPADFRFEDINHERYQKSREVFAAAISPCILPVSIHQGRNIQVSYEFYHPMSSARQFGMGQLPIGLFFADKIQCRGDISSTLMMDRLLNIPGPPLASIDNIELARFWSKNFDRWWGEWKQHIFHQSASMCMIDLFPDVIPQTTESSPPRKSNSGRDIEYAPGHLPNGGGLTPPVIGYHAPKTSSLLQGQMREPADVGRKRKTKASVIDPSALAPKKKIKKNKPKPADDLPALDPSIGQALDEEEIEEDVDQAAAEKKKTAVRKKSAATTLKPATPALADLFSFDIKDYFDEEAEEESTSKALAPLDETIKRTLEDISLWLGSSLDSLVADCGSIRARFAEIQAFILDDLANIITPAVYLEQHQFKLEKAK